MNFKELKTYNIFSHIDKYYLVILAYLLFLDIIHRVYLIYSQRQIHLCIWQIKIIVSTYFSDIEKEIVRLILSVFMFFFSQGGL